MLALQLTAKHTKCAQNARKRHFSAQYAVLLMCALLCYTAFVGFLRMLSRFHVRYARNVHAHEADSDCGAHLPASPAALAACGAKVRHENHSDKLLRENFTMKRIFRPKASFLPHRFMPNAAPYVAEAACFQHGIGPKDTSCVA